MSGKLLHKLRLYLYRKWRYSRYNFFFLVPFVSQKDKELNDILDGVCNLAVAKGFKFTKPNIRLVCKDIGENHSHWLNGKLIAKTKVVALALGSDLIVIYWATKHKLDKMELAVVVAHELGHIIDHQTNRIGHPLFDNIRHLDDEMFAHAIAAFLYSKLVVWSAYQKTGVARFNFDAFIRLNLKIDAPL